MWKTDEGTFFPDLQTAPTLSSGVRQVFMAAGNVEKVKVHSVEKTV